MEFMMKLLEGSEIMINKEIHKPNFVVLKQLNDNGPGPIYKVTICKTTLTVLEETLLSEIPKEWSVQDFYDLLDEGNRFFGNSTDRLN